MKRIPRSVWEDPQRAARWPWRALVARTERLRAQRELDEIRKIRTRLRRVTATFAAVVAQSQDEETRRVYQRLLDMARATEAAFDAEDYKLGWGRLVELNKEHYKTYTAADVKTGSVVNQSGREAAEKRRAAAEPRYARARVIVEGADPRTSTKALVLEITSATGPVEGVSLPPRHSPEKVVSHP